MRSTVHVGILITSILFMASCGGGDSNPNNANIAPKTKINSGDQIVDAVTTSLDIVQTAEGAGIFKTLLAAVDIAGLTKTLKSKGPFTVLAPNDEAFAKIPEETLNSILKDKELLTSILLYHVIAGKFEAKDVLAQDKLTTVSNLELNVSTSDEGAFINSSKILNTDILTTNGVIHVIDSVLIPEGI